jgi:tight adherence protein B
LSTGAVYAALALLFLIIAATVVGGGLIWERRYSARSRALKGRLEDVARRRSGTGPRSLMASTHLAPGPIARWIGRYHWPSTQLDRLLQRAGSRLDLDELFVITAAAWAAGSLVPALLFGWPVMVSLLVGTGVACVPWIHLAVRQRQRRMRFEQQLPEALDYMARALKAGHGLTMAMGMIGEELSDPIAGEFRTTFDHVNLGMPFDDALSALADRVGSKDLSFFVIGLMIQRRTGGNLTELLGTLASTVRERIKLAGKVRALSSEGRLSGVLLGALPFGLAGVLTLFNPAYMARLWNTETGQMLVVGATVSIAIGAAWMWKIVQVRV